MKAILTLFLGLGLTCFMQPGHAQSAFSGVVTGPDGVPLPGASIHLLATGQHIRVATDGTFRVRLPNGQDTILVTHVGYVARKIALTSETNSPMTIVLAADQNLLQEVTVNTGYYSVPKERATGSFTHIDSELLNRSVSTNILDRLEGVTNGLLFDRRNLSGEDAGGTPELRVRGLSTIEANAAPLIVIDNFPYEGDINSINPNMVESITVLRDAAAASIWGARAGNGVIVITTRNGKYNQPAQVSFTSNLSFTDKPDLFYSQKYLPSATVMDIQRELFERGSYTERDQTYIPSYVELLIKQRDGLITASEFATEEANMRSADLRRQALAYLYQVALTQQYALNINGGGSNYRYALAGGYDKDRANVIGNAGNRLNLNLRNSFKVNSALELDGGVWYTQQRRNNNGVNYRAVGLVNSGNIYDRLVNDDGTAGVVASGFRQAYRERAEDMGLLDWLYRPLDDRGLSDAGELVRDFRLTGGGSYSFLDGFRLSANYQYLLSNGSVQTIYEPESFYVRNLVNRFTQTDGTLIVPHAGVLDYGQRTETQDHSGRIQLNYNGTFNEEHELTALAGAEIRQNVSTTQSGLTVYGYNTELWSVASQQFDYDTRFPTRPTGSTRISNSIVSPFRVTNRYLSYFFNTGYHFKQRYALSGSVRWDGSNLLGVKNNQRGALLWSIGTSWEISDEDFYRVSAIPYFRVRATYGSAGNIDKSQSYYPTIQVGTNSLTGLLQSDLRSPGNPSLQWEQVNTLNAGVDWRTKRGRLSGSIEYYVKNAHYLLGDNMMDPTTGIAVRSSYKMNYGSLRTSGWDVQIDSRNLTGAFSWNSTVLLSHSRNRITEFNGPVQEYADSYFSRRLPEKGKSVDILYALPWYGLRNDNGLPLVYVDGEASDDYQNYYLNFPVEQLVEAGSQVPLLNGSLRNTLTWKGIELSALISFKFGHVFRRSSIAPGEEYFLSSTVYHTDYFRRWQKPGDELHTNVPARLPVKDLSIAPIYQYSEALVSSGDVIRLQDIRLGYSLRKSSFQRLPFQHVGIYVLARNPGILWRANDDGIDPDFPNADYPAPKSVAVGVQFTF